MGGKAFGLLALVALLAGASPPGEPGDMVVHEWGTFLGMSGSNGVSLDGMYHEEHALPAFVHARGRDQLRWRSILSKGETPVIYFYTREKRNAHVEVKFPSGIWTQWYPQARFVLPRHAELPVPATTAPRDGRIVWDLEVVPPSAKGPTPPPPATSSDALWNFARDVDAAYVKAYNPLKEPPSSWGSESRTPAGFESERFVFYRGLGTAPLPVRMTADSGGTLSIAPSGPGVTHVFVLRVEGGKGAFSYRPNLAPGETIRGVIPSLDKARPAAQFSDALADELAARLVESGLYPKEARAMVNTWRSSYFGTEGVRALFVMPQFWTDAFIPMTISPRPKAVTRVMVGRMELLTPARERLAEAAVRDLTSPDPSKRLAAFKTLSAQGRYVEPVVRRVLVATRDDAVRDLCRRLLLADYVTDLRAATRSPVATKDVPPMMVRNEEPAHLRARLAELLREVGLNDEAKVEGKAALALLARKTPVPPNSCESRLDLRAFALAVEGTGDDRAAAERYGRLVDLGGLATRKQDCRQCHRKVGADVDDRLPDWWAGESYARVVKRAGMLDETIAKQEAALGSRTGRDAARLRLAYLYQAGGRKADAAVLWAAFSPVQIPVTLEDLWPKPAVTR